MKCPSRLYPECYSNCPDKDVCEDWIDGDDPMDEEMQERFNQTFERAFGLKEVKIEPRRTQ